MHVPKDYNSEGSVSHINSVWPVLSDKQLFTARNLTLRAKTKPTIEPPTSAFFLAEARVHSFFWAVMSELENLVRGLSNKVDGIQKDLDNLKKHSGKLNKHGKHRSRQPSILLIMEQYPYLAKHVLWRNAPFYTC